MLYWPFGLRNHERAMLHSWEMNTAHTRFLSDVVSPSICSMGTCFQSIIESKEAVGLAGCALTAMFPFHLMTSHDMFWQSFSRYSKCVLFRTRGLAQHPRHWSAWTQLGRSLWSLSPPILYQDSGHGCKADGKLESGRLVHLTNFLSCLASKQFTNETSSTAILSPTTS